MSVKLGDATMIERVASAVAGSLNGAREDWAEVMAVAAIRAMLTPTDEMARAAAKAAWHSGSGQDPRNVCRAIIIAALYEP